MTMIICEDCMTVFEGTRADARRSRWEPFSARTQWGIDQGPMVCPTCIGQALQELTAALKAVGPSDPRWTRGNPLNRGWE